jgi:MFS family permease
MNRKATYIYSVFIAMGAVWGLILGALGGFIVTVWMMLSIPLTTIQNEIEYTLKGALFGIVTGTLHGLFLAFLTELAESNPRSRRFDYHGMMVGISALSVFALCFGIIAKSRPLFSPGFMDYAVRGFIVSLILATAAAFISHQTARWYLKQEFVKKKQGDPSQREEQGYLPHPSLSETLDEQEHQQRDVDPDEDVRDHQHRAG